MIGDLMLIKLALYESWRGSEEQGGGPWVVKTRGISRVGCLSRVRRVARIHEARMHERSHSQGKSQRGGAATRAPFQPRDKHAHAQKVNNGAGTRVA